MTDERALVDETAVVEVFPFNAPTVPEFTGANASSAVTDVQADNPAGTVLGTKDEIGLVLV